MGTRHYLSALKRAVRELLLAAKPASLGEHLEARRRPPPGAPPLPGPRLMVSTAGTAGVRWFLDSGRAGWETVVEAVGRQGVEPLGLDRVLDFGCGCGRVLRHWPPGPRPALFGCDVNRRAVSWIRRHLPRVRAEVTGLDPPLPWADATFDLAYAFSVFTHLPRPLQERWRDELRRVIRPGGWLLLSVHGAAYLDRLDATERAAFARGELVERRPDLPGTNTCGVYHPPAAVQKLLATGFELVELVAEGARGNPPQDLVVLRRTG